MNRAEFRRRVYSAYFSSHFGNVRSNVPSLRTFERVAKGMHSNLKRHMQRLPPGARVLDVGCGVGHCLYYLAKQGFRAEGVDWSAQQLEEGRKLLPPDVQLHCADAKDFLAEHPETFDAIVCNDMLEHLLNYEALEMMDLICAGLRPGGVFVARLPNASCPSSASLTFIDVTHERSFTEKSAAQLLRIAGFDDVRMSSWDFPNLTPMHWIPWLLRHCLWGLYRLRLLIHNYFPPPRIVSRLFVVSGRKAK
jgi:2-polyprenyl-3-methyl-5-hydroxy-6-metoxy-1,4-benzoquinol methylase